ncbi:unnamed protein product [Orchesella dallaii]|uniref:Ig-like domain-containing protein n=1 Tax=Orchesella dallaii TaxID=48710 RepID=A0ABP1QS77_9HEXA
MGINLLANIKMGPHRWNSVWMVLVILSAFRISDTFAKVYINELRVPQSVQNGTEDAVILDCDYTLETEDKNGLVVKWFFNKGGTPVYQWISKNKPQALGILRDRVDIKYKASEDSYKKHSGIKIIKPTTELSGEWACRVSSFASEATAASRMVVYAPPKEMEVTLVSPRPTLNSINISCWANGVYPEPRLTITLKNEKLEDVMHDSTWNDGAYDVRVSAVVQDEDIAELPAIFDCELKIPNTSYINRKSVLYGGPVVIVESANETSPASAPQFNKGRSTLLTWFNIILVLAVNMKIFGIS